VALRYRVFSDGASRNNPGPASIGVAVFDASGAEVATLSEAIGVATNNVAEYRALVRALDLLEELGAREADFCLDSELVVRQLTGVYKVKDAKMRVLAAQVRAGLAKLTDYSICHVPRAQNKRADQLANQALDAGPRP